MKWIRLTEGRVRTIFLRVEDILVVHESFDGKNISNTEIVVRVGESHIKYIVGESFARIMEIICAETNSSILTLE